MGSSQGNRAKALSTIETSIGSCCHIPTSFLTTRGNSRNASRPTEPESKAQNRYVRTADPTKGTRPRHQRTVFSSMGFSPQAESQTLNVKASFPNPTRSDSPGRLKPFTISRGPQSASYKLRRSQAKVESQIKQANLLTKVKDEAYETYRSIVDESKQTRLH